MSIFVLLHSGTGTHSGAGGGQKVWKSFVIKPQIHPSHLVKASLERGRVTYSFEQQMNMEENPSRGVERDYQ